MILNFPTDRLTGVIPLVLHVLLTSQLYTIHAKTCSLPSPSRDVEYQSTANIIRII